jgi:hypothetical protein
MAENKDTKSYKRIMQLVENSMAIEAEAAKEAKAIGYMARALVQATMPHSKPTETSFVKKRLNFMVEVCFSLPNTIGLAYSAPEFSLYCPILCSVFLEAP